MDKAIHFCLPPLALSGSQDAETHYGSVVGPGYCIINQWKFSEHCHNPHNVMDGCVTVARIAFFRNGQWKQGIPH